MAHFPKPGRFRESFYIVTFCDKLQRIAIVEQIAHDRQEGRKDLRRL
jgi:hypothetical protein